MTVNEAIGRFDLLNPNAFPFAVKRDLLAGLEGRLQNELFCLYVGFPDTGDAAFTGETELLAPFPYDDLYVKFLAAETDRLNGDVGRYVNGAAVFNDAVEALAVHLLKTRRRRREPKVRLPEVTA